MIFNAKLSCNRASIGSDKCELGDLITIKGDDDGE